MSNTDQTIHLDAFATQLQNTKILCLGQFQQAKFPPLQDSIKDIRAAPKKKIWLGRQLTGIPVFPAIYDAQYAIADSLDWTLALTYIAHCAKPALLVIEELQIPSAVWQRLPRDGLTTLVFQTQPPPSIAPYDTVFFAPVIDLNSQISFVNTIINYFQQIFRSPAYQPKEYRDILQELRVANAGLVWTRVGEQTSQGALYWYDSGPLQNSEQLSKKQLADLFTRLAAQFT